MAKKDVQEVEEVEEEELETPSGDGYFFPEKLEEARVHFTENIYPRFENDEGGIRLDDAIINQVAMQFAPKSAMEVIETVMNQPEFLFYEVSKGLLLYDVVRATCVKRISVLLISVYQQLESQKQMALSRMAPEQTLRVAKGVPGELAKNLKH